jgi:multidrug efflux system outer membrane protein
MPLLGLIILLFSGCALGPDYQPPEPLAPSAYKHGAPWKEASPADLLAKGAWWEIYADLKLNRLEEQAAEANQSLKATYARMAQIQAAAGISAAERVPRLDLNASASRKRSSGDLLPPGQLQISNQFDLPFVLSYEIDLWGRVRRSVEAATADAQKATADYQALLLTLQADVAQSYFRLRALDAEISLLEQSVVLRQEALRMVKSRYEHGQIGQIDLLRAETELTLTQGERVGLQKQRSELENRIATLIGKSASNFSLAAAPLENEPPPIKAGLPSSLLERRPDVAAAERQMAAASARIGVAKTAFFPAISLTGSAGFSSKQAGNLFDWDNRTWGLGPAVSLPIFDGGRNSANYDRSKSAYEEAIANYRQQVLVAFQEVEDGLSGLQLLDQQNRFFQQAVKAAIEAREISEKRYRAGLVSYIEVIDTQRSALQAKRQHTINRGQQMTTSVLLIKALGGGWDLEIDAVKR